MEAAELFLNLDIIVLPEHQRGMAGTSRDVILPCLLQDCLDGATDLRSELTLVVSGLVVLADQVAARRLRNEKASSAPCRFRKGSASLQRLGIKCWERTRRGRNRVPWWTSRPSIAHGGISIIRKHQQGYGSLT